MLQVRNAANQAAKSCSSSDEPRISTLRPFAVMAGVSPFMVASSSAIRPSIVWRLMRDSFDAGVRNATAMLLEVEGFIVARAASLSEAVQEYQRALGLGLQTGDVQAHLDRALAELGEAATGAP